MRKRCQYRFCDSPPVKSLEPRAYRLHLLFIKREGAVKVHVDDRKPILPAIHHAGNEGSEEHQQQHATPHSASKRSNSLLDRSRLTSIPGQGYKISLTADI